MATAVGALRVDLSANTAAFSRDMGKAAKAVTSGSARMNKALTRVHRNLTLGAKKMKSFAGTMLPLNSMFAGLVACGLVIATKKALDTADAKVKDAVRAGALDKEPLATLIERAVVQGVSSKPMNTNACKRPKRPGTTSSRLISLIPKPTPGSGDDGSVVK